MNHLTHTTLGAAFVAAIVTASAEARFGDNYFHGGGPVDVWSNPANWSLGVPGFGDIAYVGQTVEAHNAFLEFDMDVVDIATLTITDGMAVRSNGYVLSGNNTWVSMSGRNPDDQQPNVFWPSRFVLENGPAATDALVELVTTYDEASFHLDGAKIRITERLITDPTSGAYGTGTWEFTRNDPMWLSLDNKGYFSGQPGVTVVQQLGASRFDLDGSNQDETGHISASVASGQLGTTIIFNGTSLADDFDGEMSIAFNGRIDMNMSSNWTLGSNGLLHFVIGDPNETPTLGGSTMTVLGDIEADARNSVVEANVVILNGSHTTVGTNDSLTFTGNTIANTALFTVNDGGTLDFAGPLNAQGNGFQLAGGTVTGGIIQNTGTYGFRGYGTVNNRVINDATLYAEDGGTLLVNGTHNDWDGIGNAGKLQAWGGDLHVTDNQDATFAGEMWIFQDDEIFVDGFGMDLTPASYMYLWGGTLRATDPMTIGGTVDVLGEPSMAADVEFTATNETTVGTLNLLQDAIVHPGATFVGPPDGRIVGGGTGELELMNGAVVDVTVAGNGTTHVQRFGPGEATVNGDFLLGGTLALQAGPPLPLTFDRLIVSDTFEARGVIEVTPWLGYQYQFGDEYDLLDFATFVDLGYELVLPPLASDLDWDTSDFETDGTIRIVVDTCRADVNDDGVVNFADLLLVLASWGTPDIATDIDQNGDVGFSDILELLAAWGACP